MFDNMFENRLGCINIYICLLIYTYTHIHTHIHTYIHTYIVYIYTYIYTHICTCGIFLFKKQLWLYI